MDKILTLCIPVYNMEKYLSRCLDSLNIKRNKNVEFIVVNDGSSDNSLDIINKYRRDNVIVINKKNEGHGPAIRDGIINASGKYFKVLDSDDWFDTSSFDELLELLSRSDYDLVLNDFDEMHFDKNNNEFHIVPMLIEEVYNNLLSKGQEFSPVELLGKPIPYMYNLHRVTYKTTILKNTKIDFPPKMYYTDFHYALTPILHVKTAYYFGTHLYKYFLGRDGQSVDPNLQLKYNHFNINHYKYFYNLYLESKSSKICKLYKEMSRHFQNQIFQNISVLTSKEIKKYIKENNVTFKELSVKNKVKYIMIKLMIFKICILILSHKK